MTGLIWDAVAIVFAVFCLLTAMALAGVAAAFCYAVVKAIKAQIERERGERK